MTIGNDTKGIDGDLDRSSFLAIAVRKALFEIKVKKKEIGV